MLIMSQFILISEFELTLDFFKTFNTYDLKQN